MIDQLKGIWNNLSFVEKLVTVFAAGLLLGALVL